MFVPAGQLRSQILPEPVGSTSRLRWAEDTPRPVFRMHQGVCLESKQRCGLRPWSSHSELGLLAPSGLLKGEMFLWGLRVSQQSRGRCVWSPGVGNPRTGDGRWPSSPVLSVGTQGGGVDGVAQSSARLLTRALGKRFTEAAHPRPPPQRCPGVC